MALQQDALEVDALLVEYEKVRDELICFTQSMHQIFLWSLGSASIILPVITTTYSRLPQDVVVFGCLVFAIGYAVLGIEFATSAFYINSLGGYTSSYLMPRLNSTIGTTETTRVLQWENYMRRRHRNPALLFISTAGPTSASILIVIPSIVSILLANYVANSNLVTNAFIPGQALIPSLIPITYVMAWFFFVVSVIAQVLNVIVSLNSGYVAQKN